MKNPYWFVLSGTRGAATRGRILQAVGSEPSTVEDLTEWLELDDGTVEDHLDVLRQNDLVEVSERGDESRYLPTHRASADWEAIDGAIGDVDVGGPEPPIPKNPE